MDRVLNIEADTTVMVRGAVAVDERVSWYAEVRVAVSFNHVSVKNPKLGFKSKITERTSSILGAKDIVLARRTLGPNTDFFPPDRIGTTRFELLR